MPTHASSTTLDMLTPCALARARKGNSAGVANATDRTIDGGRTVAAGGSGRQRTTYTHIPHGLRGLTPTSQEKI